jgi:hypothetical protein
MGTKVSITLGDDHGRQTTRVFGMETQALLADYNTEIAAFLTALEAVTDMSCIKATFLIPVAADPTWAVTADANKDTGATATGWIDAGSGKKASTKWPGVSYSLVGADGSIAITAAVATYLAMFEEAGAFTLSDGEQIASWLKASLDG